MTRRGKLGSEGTERRSSTSASWLYQTTQVATSRPLQAGRNYVRALQKFSRCQVQSMSGCGVYKLMPNLYGVGVAQCLHFHLQTLLS